MILKSKKKGLIWIFNSVVNMIYIDCVMQKHKISLLNNKKLKGQLKRQSMNNMFS